MKGETNTVSLPAGEKARVSAQRLAGHVRTIFVTIVVALLLKTFVVEAYRIPTASMENTLLVGDFLLVNKLAYGIRTPRFIPLTHVVIPSFVIPVFGHVERGDVVVFEYPEDLERKEIPEPVFYVKRCIGLPGDKVEIRNGRVSVNGRVMLMPEHGISKSGWSGSYGPVVVPGKGQKIELHERNLEQWRTLLVREGHEVELSKNGQLLIDGKVQSQYVVKKDYFFVIGDNRDNSVDSRYWGFVPEENLVGEAFMVYWSWDPDVPVNSLDEKLKTIRWERVGKLIR